MTHKQVEINMYRFPDHLLLMLKVFLKKKKKFSQENETLLSADAQLTVGTCLQRPKIPMWVFYYRVELSEKGKFIHCNTCSNTIVMGEWPS